MKTGVSLLYCALRRKLDRGQRFTANTLSRSLQKLSLCLDLALRRLGLSATLGSQLPVNSHKPETCFKFVAHLLNVIEHEAIG